MNPEIQHSIVDVAKLEWMVQFVQKGGKLAAWTLVGTASGLSVGLIAHAELSLGIIGALFGSGFYGVRLFQKFKDPDMDQLQQKLDGLQRMYDSGSISEDEYVRAKKKVLEGAKL
jgi:hypothetical protein